MPTYDYVCDGCGHAFELFQSMSAPKKRKCPVCAKAKLRRLIGSGAGIIFKGSGFYETDYKKKPAPPKDAPDKPKDGDTKPASEAAKPDKPAGEKEPAKAKKKGD